MDSAAVEVNGKKTNCLQDKGETVTEWRSLKSLDKRIIQKLRPLSARQPDVWRVKTSSGNCYKLLTVNESNRHKLSYIDENEGLYASLDFVPRIICRNETSVVVEYIEGIVPDVGSGAFASMLAAGLVQVHGMNVFRKPFENVRTGLGKSIEYLHAQGGISATFAKRIYEKLDSCAPEHVRLSTDYTDLKSGNFVLGADDKLYFVDLGGFKNNRVTGEALLRDSHLKRKMNYSEFTRAYRGLKGEEFIFQYEDFITLCGAIRKSATSMRHIRERPVYEWRYKKGWRAAVEKNIGLIQSIVT